jgi:hypothetical protein
MTRKLKPSGVAEKTVFVVRVVVPDDDVMDCGVLLGLAQKDELYLSVSKRPCSVFSRHLAKHETENRALSWLRNVNKCSSYGYFVMRLTEYC